MIRAVSYADILNDPNSKALFREYAAECSIPELGYASPQPELYERLEKSGGFQAFGVYEDNTLVGFATVMIYVLPHYGQKIAASESIFLMQSYRATVGIEILRFIEQYAKDEECLVFLYSAPIGSRFDLMLTYSDRYRHTNNVHLRNLA